MREKQKRRRQQAMKRRSSRAGESEQAPAAASPDAPLGAQAARKGPSKDDLARERLVALEEGERPLAVTIGAIISGLLGLTTVVLFAFGVDTGDTEPSGAGTLVYAALMLVMSAGMWRVRYWAVLGFQALLALLIVVWSLLLVKAESVLAVLVALAVILPAGTLFWFLVKSLARIQMPDRRSPSG